MVYSAKFSIISNPRVSSSHPSSPKPKSPAPCMQAVAMIAVHSCTTRRPASPPSFSANLLNSNLAYCILACAANKLNCVSCILSKVY